MKMDSLTLLLIEDHKLSTKMFKSALQKHRIISAFNGLGGVEAFIKSRPHMVFLDIVLPDISGFEVLRRIRSLDHYAHIVVVSGMKNEADVDACRNLGADGFIGKPYNKEHIDFYIQRYRQMYAV